MKKLTGVFFTVFFSIVLFAPLNGVRAQAADVTIQLNEQFFDALLDALFKNGGAPEYPLARINPHSPAAGAAPLEIPTLAQKSAFANSFAGRQSPPPENQPPPSAVPCDETIKLQREIDGVRTSVKFRDGRISAPIAFSGSYNPPLIGCVGFSGWAETTVALEFDQGRQTLVGRAQIVGVNLSGAGGVGSSLIARLVQGSIDKKLNPLQILQTDKVSFVIPIQNGASLRMKAVGVRHEVANGVLLVHITYNFS